MNRLDFYVIEVKWFLIWGNVKGLAKLQRRLRDIIKNGHNADDHKFVPMQGMEGSGICEKCGGARISSETPRFGSPDEAHEARLFQIERSIVDLLNGMSKLMGP